jgi:hypothetical protein
MLVLVLCERSNDCSMLERIRTQLLNSVQFKMLNFRFSTINSSDYMKVLNLGIDSYVIFAAISQI